MGTKSKTIINSKTLYLLVIMLIALLIIIYFRSPKIAGYLSPAFCTPEDELYLKIKEDAESWIEILPSTKDWNEYFAAFSPSYSVTPVPLEPGYRFAVPSGRKYMVLGDSMMHDIGPYFLYIPIQQSLPKSPMGINGYIYMIDGELPYFNPSIMKVVKIDDRIYCYEEI